MRNFKNYRALLSIAAIALTTSAVAPPAEAQMPGRDSKGMPAIPPGGPNRVGARVERLRLTLPVDPVVVIVPNGDAYIDAISRWSVDHRFPVLIDDGTPSARENIARFIKSFEPDEVLLWQGGRPSDAPFRERIDSAFHSAWGAESFDELRTIWSEMDIQPPGVVVTTQGDSAWPAALALAAGRAQPIIWVDGRLGNIGGVGKLSTFRNFERQIKDQFKNLRFTWSQVGDDIDAITVCKNMPTRVWSSESVSDRQVVAMTDLLGRYEDGRIYAWAGVIFGTEAESAYRAMGSLFLQPDSFWMFNGYSTRPPEDGYTVETAASILRRLRHDITTYSPPRNTVDDWRAATAKPVDAGFIHVNASGHREWFELNPGRAFTSDIPFLDQASIVTFIHSFSAQNLDDRDSIARRWLDNGAYALMGSVDEPYLQGFTPPAYLIPGLYTPMPLGVMVRPNSNNAWKVNTLGDPLITLGPKAPRTERIPALPGSKNLEDSMKAALGQREYAQAIRQFIMMGRTRDVSQLGKAIITQDTDALTPEVAEMLAPVFYRTGRTDMLTKCYLAMDEQTRKDTITVDMLWKAVGGELESTRNEEIIDAMNDNVRDLTFVEDITAVSNAIRRLRGDAAALSMLMRYERSPDVSDDRKRFIRRAMERIDPSRR